MFFTNTYLILLIRLPVGTGVYAQAVVYSFLGEHPDTIIGLCFANILYVEFEPKTMNYIYFSIYLIIA